MPGTSSYSSEYNPQEAQLNTGLLASESLFKRWLRVSVHLLFPPRCAGCGRVDNFLCPRCHAEINRIPFDIVVEPRLPLVNIAATALHIGKLQQALWSLKYEYTPELAEPLGKRMAALLATLNWTIDIIVPVPLHMTRLRERGYNQSQLLGECVARESGLICRPAALRRIRQTQSQVTLSAQERQANMQDAFEADPQIISGRTILLIDDVYTTGATLAACAQAALDVGAFAVYGLTMTTPRGS